MTTAQTKLTANQAQLKALLSQRNALVEWYYKQSDRFECVKEVRATKDAITVQIEAIDAQIEAFENDLTEVRSEQNISDKIAELNIKRDKLCVRYDSKNKQIADLKREYYVIHRSTKNIMQSDVAEDLTNLRNSRDKIDAQIEVIDAQIELLEN
jgi:dynactin complex subunit